jgi:hypothetical protein
MADERKYSRFRDFLIPDAQNTLQSASHRHSLGDYDDANELLEQTKKKIENCQRQLQEDKQREEKESGQS